MPLRWQPPASCPLQAAGLAEQPLWCAPPAGSPSSTSYSTASPSAASSSWASSTACSSAVRGGGVARRGAVCRTRGDLRGHARAWHLPWTPSPAPCPLIPDLPPSLPSNTALPLPALQKYDAQSASPSLCTSTAPPSRPPRCWAACRARTATATRPCSPRQRRTRACSCCASSEGLEGRGGGREQAGWAAPCAARGAGAL